MVEVESVLKVMDLKVSPGSRTCVIGWRVSDSYLLGGFRIVARAADNAVVDVKTVEGDQRTAVVQHLQPGAKYSVEIHALHEEGHQATSFSTPTPKGFPN